MVLIIDVTNGNVCNLIDGVDEIVAANVVAAAIQQADNDNDFAEENEKKETSSSSVSISSDDDEKENKEENENGNILED